MKYFLLMICLSFGLQGCTQTSSEESRSLLDQMVATNYEVALAEIDSLYKTEDISFEEFSQMVVGSMNPEDLSTVKMTYKELLEQSREAAHQLKSGKQIVEGGVRIVNQGLKFVGQNRDSAEFDLAFQVENLLGEAIYDMDLMIATYRPDGTDDYGSTGGNGYLKGQVLTAGETSANLHFPIVLYFSEEDDPEGEYGTYAIVRNLRAGGKEVVVLTPFDLKLETGWVVLPR